MYEGAGARGRAEHGGAVQQPGQGDLPGRRTVRGGDRVAHTGSAVNEPLPSGNHGRKAIPCASHSFSSGSEARSSRL